MPLLVCGQNWQQPFSDHDWKGQIKVLQKLSLFDKYQKLLPTYVRWQYLTARVLINGKKVFDVPSQSGYIHICHMCHVETSPDVTLLIFLYYDIM